jgi:hypothetical protein
VIITGAVVTSINPSLNAIIFFIKVTRMGNS